MSDRTCADPGCTNVVGVLPGRGRPRKFCDEHRRVDARRDRPNYYKKKTPVESVCPRCGDSFMQDHPRQKYCCKSCKDRGGGPACYVCGLETASGGNGVGKEGSAKHHTCFEHGTVQGYQKHGCRCDECRAVYSEWRQQYRKRKYPKVVCAYCLEPFAFGARGADIPLHHGCRGNIPEWKRRGDEPPRVRAFRRKTAKNAKGRSGGDRVWVQGPCAWCGEQFLAARGKYCSDTCKNRASVHRHLSKHGRFSVSQRDRAVIYERDKFKCYLCGKHVDVSLPYPDAWGPSLDHVVPQSHGGSHDADNLRLAHLMCNSVRRDLSVREARDVIKRGEVLTLLW